MKEKDKTLKLIYLSAIFIFALSTLSHFMFKWSNYSYFLSAFVPTNESLFQHIKMFIYPTILYYLVTFILFSNKYHIDAKRYFIAPLITILTTSFIVTGTYYTFKNGFNVSSMVLDIASLVIGLFLSSLISAAIYKKKRVVKFSGYASLVLIFAIAVAITYFQINPQPVDFFYDNEHQTYNEVIE